MAAILPADDDSALSKCPFLNGKIKLPAGD